MFDKLAATATDPLLGLIATFKADTRTDKADLWVGVYKGDNGQTSVIDAVKLAEQQLVGSQLFKSYLGSNGNPEFVELMARFTFDSELPNSRHMIGI